MKRVALGFAGLKRVAPGGAPSHYPRVIRIAIPLVAVAAAAGAGCGDDEDSDVTTPTISIPSVTAPSAPPTVTSEEPTGGTPPEATTTTKRGSYDPGKPDSPENDVPPPAGSPQEAFEKQCEQNPAACE